MKKQPTLVKSDTALLPLGAMMCGMAVITPVMSVQAAEADQKLKTVVVKDAQEKDPLNLNENNGYQGTKTRIGKTAQDPHDIPQGVTVLTRELLNDQQASSLKDALRNVSGLTFNAAEGGRAGDNINLRGFYSFGDLYLDGIRDTAQYNREIFAFEQVEVLRGAGSMLFGRGQAGGVINMVSKTPKLKDANRVTASVGSNGYQQATGDFNKKIGDTTAIRVNVMKRGEGSFRENVETGTSPTIEREGIAPSISFGLGTNNQFTLSHYYVKTDDNPDFGINFSNNKLPMSENIGKFAGNKNTFDRSETNISTLSHLYRFSNNTEVRTQLRSSHIKRDYIAGKPTSTGLTFDRPPVNRSIDVNNLAVQSDISHKTTLAGMKHEMLAGVEYLNEDGWRSSMQNLAPAGSPASAGIYVPGVYNTTAPITYKGDTYSVFVQDQVEFVKDWKFLLGVRHDDMKAKYSNVPNLNYSTQSYRTGLSWQPQDWAHYYLAWSDSVSPTADLNQTSGGFYPPERSQVTELGAKWLFMEGDLALRAAIFRADKQYERNTDLESTAGILTNKRRTDGIEFEVAGRITPKWNMFAGISLMDPRITEVAQNRAANGTITNTDPRLQGQITRNTPTYTYNMWTTYAFMPKWKAGVGFDAKSERYAYSPNTANANNSFTNGVFDPNKAPAYVRWDGMLAFEEKNYAVRLNVYNLTDTDWYESVYDNGGFVVPGMKQTAVLTTELKF